jgi:hypothetical protein
MTTTTPTYAEATVIYDLDDEANWGYSYNALRDAQGRYWFSQDAIEQYEMDWSEVDGIDFGVLLDRDDAARVICASYFRRDVENGPVVRLDEFPMTVIDGAPYWFIPEEWRPVRDSDFEDD